MSIPMKNECPDDLTPDVFAERTKSLLSKGFIKIEDEHIVITEKGKAAFWDMALWGTKNYLY